MGILLYDAVRHSLRFSFTVVQMDEGVSEQVEFIWHKAPEYPSWHMHK